MGQWRMRDCFGYQRVTQSFGKCPFMWSGKKKVGDRSASKREKEEAERRDGSGGAFGRAVTGERGGAGGWEWERTLTTGKKGEHICVLNEQRGNGG